MISSNAASERIARRVSITGIVQGVGFRPFVYRLAQQRHVTGWVLNDAAGVEIHVEAAAEQVAAFLADLHTDAPAAARVTRITVSDALSEGSVEFAIRESHRDVRPTARISPDLAVCDACVAELRNANDPRFGYPYINCANCGPRFSILHNLPYDRNATTMRAWAMCAECRREYEDPRNRRYHAQPVACARCGPSYYLREGDCLTRDLSAALKRAVELLIGGAIVAIKGIGGYHLACDARNESAVAALRERKYRKEKPFALLAPGLNGAAELIDCSPEHARWLTHVARPIVLGHAKVRLAGVAPDSDVLGVMLPSTPLHHLLFDAGAPSPLVMTSANHSSEPIAYQDEDAILRLTGIADAFLIGERPIARRIDDSVMSVRGGEPFMIRRARGFAPAAVCSLPKTAPILALGSDLKNTITLVVDGEALTSQHIGDLGDVETETALRETVQDLLTMYRIDSDELTIVHDLHPEFASTRLAEQLPSKRRLAVQHHHAHIASVMAEHALLDERVVGVALDGTGFGADGSIWGGEVFLGSGRGGFDRVAFLRPTSMPGGDAAARYPVQAAAAFLAEVADLPDMAAEPFCFPARYFQARRMIERRVRCFPSTSMGRLFDAVAALLGYTREISFEGQAAIWLQHQAVRSEPQPPYPFANLDFRPLIAAIMADRTKGRPSEEIAYAFHAAVANEIADLVSRLCVEADVHIAAFSGGVFQNDLLYELLTAEFGMQSKPPGLLWNRLAPANDGGISLGQAALAAAIVNESPKSTTRST